MSKTPPPGGLGDARIVRNGLGHTVVWVQAYSAILERETPPHSLPVACKSGPTYSMACTLGDVLGIGSEDILVEALNCRGFESHPLLQSNPRHARSIR